MEVIKIDSVHREDGYIKVDRDFKDMIISALRYAIPRHSYIVDMTVEYIKKNADLILDDRVVAIMMRDLNEHLGSVEYNPVPSWLQYDVDLLEDLLNFLEDYDVKKTS